MPEIIPLISDDAQAVVDAITAAAQTIAISVNRLAIITEYWHEISQAKGDISTRGKLSLNIVEPHVNSIGIIAAHASVLSSLE